MAKPRQAPPPFPERTQYAQDFNYLLTNNTGNFTIPELTTNALYLRNVDLLEGWSGYCLQMAGNRQSFCYIPSLTGPKKNFSATDSSFRMWFSPSYFSGQGPGQIAKIIEVCEVADNPAAGWTLYVNPQGTKLHLSAFAAGKAWDVLY